MTNADGSDNNHELSCAICFEEYSSDFCSVNERFPSSVCQHGICLKCVIQHVLAYQRHGCPLCREEQAFQEESLQAHVSSYERNSAIEPLIASALDTRVRETILYPCIERMTEMLAATTDDDSDAETGNGETRPHLPALRISPRHVLSTCAVLRREDSFEATFALTSQDSDETLFFRAEHAPVVPRRRDEGGRRSVE